MPEAATDTMAVASILMMIFGGDFDRPLFCRHVSILCGTRINIISSLFGILNPSSEGPIACRGCARIP
jgi:hypothetical protein